MFTIILTPGAHALRAAALSLAVAMASPALAQEGDYRLDSMDKLKVRIAEWQSAEAVVRDWAAINGDYVVSASGSVSLPLLGELPARGRTTEEIAVAIGDGLQQKFGLPDKPDAAVELAEYRPFFIAGDVETPGRYPFNPQLNVLKALSVAGGIRRADNGATGAPRDFVSALGNFDVLAAQRSGLLARRARLTAESSGAETIEFPPELDKTPAGKQHMADEMAFKDAREKKLKLQLQGLAEMKQLLGNEIVSLQKKIESQNRQLELAKSQIEDVDGLAGKGLVSNQRVLALSQSAAELESKILDMETSILRARQDIAKATQDETTLQNDRRSEIASDLQATGAAIDEANVRAQMYSGLMKEALGRAPEAAAAAQAGQIAVSYTIVRTAEGKTTEIPAEENSAVLPGDVVKVSIETPGLQSN